MTQEAVLSSQIEGTQATFGEVLEYEASPASHSEKKQDIKEVINYRKAMNFGIDWLKEKPTSYNLLKLLHEILLTDTRGKNKGIGMFRNGQNWIGKPNSSIEKARFIPPAPDNIMPHFTNLEKYIH
jgi:Fic family protein